MAVMASDGPSSHSPFLRLGLPAPQPSRHHHAQSLLGPPFMTQERIMLSNPTPSSRVSLPPRRKATIICRLSLHPCTVPVSCSLYSLLWLLLLSFKPFLLRFVSIVSLLLNHGNLIFQFVCVFLPCPLLPLLFWSKFCLVFTFFQQLMTKRLWVIYTYTCSPMFSIDVVASAPDDPSFQNVFHIRKYGMQLPPATLPLIQIRCFIQKSLL